MEKDDLVKVLKKGVNKTNAKLDCKLASVKFIILEFRYSGHKKIKR